MNSRIRIVLVLVFPLLMTESSPLFATDHFNLESGIPTMIEDIEPIERGSVELQGFGRYLRLRGENNSGEVQPRLAWGILENTQVEVGTPLILGEGVANGNGDVQISLLRKFWDDKRLLWLPGFALEADVRLPTGVESQKFKNRGSAGFTAILKKDVGPHSFHFNAGFNWAADESEKENLRRGVWSIVVGHDMPLTKWIILVSDVVWSQADDKDTRDVWLFETGVRSQLTRSIIGAIGIGIGLNRGQETPIFTLNAGFQFGL